MSKKKKNIERTKKINTIKPIIDVLEEVKNNSFVKNSELFENDFEYIIERLKDDSFRLAVVGEFSSGKSTFLNALIGKDLLKHGAQETTATVTEIYNKNVESNETYLDVYFANGDVVQKVPADKMTEYTATASTTHFVAKEIDRVVISSKILENDANVCFVDTPGLNGIADNHREKTIEQIKNAHACIYLMQVRGLGQSDIDFLKYITKYQHNIIFVQNFIDELKRLEGETPEQKISEQRKIIENKIINGNDKVHYEIVAVSSRKALISRSNEFEKYNDEIITEEVRERLYEESRFNDVLSAINNLMDNNEKEKIQQKDAVVVAVDILKKLSEVVSFKNEKEMGEWEKSVDGRNFANYSRLIDILRKNKETYIQKLDNYIESEVSEIRKENKREIDEGLQKIEESSKTIISEINIISEFEKYVKDSLPGFLYQNITAMDEESIKQMNKKFENMVTNAVLRISQYVGVKAETADLKEFEGVVIEKEVQNFKKEEDRINKLQKELSEKEILDKKANDDIQRRQLEKEQIDSEIESRNSSIERERRHKDAEISRLGSMPEKETKYRSEIYYEDRGGIGFLADLFLGPKKKTRSVPYTDDSKQQKWKKQKSDIETKYRMKENQLKSEKRKLETKKQQCDDEIRHLKETEEMRKKDIQSTQRLLEARIELYEEQKEKAKQEYLREEKRSILENIHDYLYETIQEMLYENYQNAIDENRKRATKIINSLFAISYENRINLLQKLLNKTNDTKDIDNTKDLLNVIQSAILRLEEFLCHQ